LSASIYTLACDNITYNNVKVLCQTDPDIVGYWNTVNSISCYPDVNNSDQHINECETASNTSHFPTGPCGQHELDCVVMSDHTSSGVESIVYYRLNEFHFRTINCPSCTTYWDPDTLVAPGTSNLNISTTNAVDTNISCSGSYTEDSYYDWAWKGYQTRQIDNTGDTNCTITVTNGSGGSATCTNSLSSVACGSDNGGTFTTKPSTSLCYGTDDITWTDSTADDGTWNWLCSSVASCYANNDGGDGGSYSCTGTLPDGATECEGDSTGLTENTAWTAVSECTETRKCEYITEDEEFCSCGLSDGESYSSKPTDNLCSTGSAIWTDTSGSDGDYNWTCCGNDCSATKIECGNGVCEEGEDEELCPDDCAPVCGNGECENTENILNCPEDCSSDWKEI